MSFEDNKERIARRKEHEAAVARARTLDEVYDLYREDEQFEHLRLPGINLVPGYGEIGRGWCKVMLVGEAPGAQENKRLRPFCGPSGRVLDGLMECAGIRLDIDHDDRCDRPETGICAVTQARLSCSQANAYVTNVVKYRPPGNRTPSVGETLAGMPYLRREWALLGSPRMIIMVGGTARSTFAGGVPERYPWGRQNFVRAEGLPGDRLWFSAQYHPAYGLRKGKKVQEQMERHWEELGIFLAEEGIL